MSTTAKLYRVTITEIYPDIPRAWVTRKWVAARTRKEAESKALHDGQYQPADLRHVFIECMVRGSAFIGCTRLEKPQ